MADWATDSTSHWTFQDQRWLQRGLTNHPPSPVLVHLRPAGLLQAHHEAARLPAQPVSRDLVAGDLPARCAALCQS